MNPYEQARVHVVYCSVGSNEGSAPLVRTGNPPPICATTSCWPLTAR